MKHVSVYENFGSNPQSVIDFFDLTFTLVLHNRTIIKGLIQNEDAVKELFSDDIQRGLINKCYYNTHRYILNESEVKRAECAEKNIREYIGNKLEELDCKIEYYRPMYINQDLDKIRVCAPFATWSTGNELEIKKDFYDKNSQAAEKQIPEIIAAVKEFAKKYGVNYVLPDIYVERPLDILSRPERDTETSNSHINLRGVKEPIFISIQDFEWEKYYW